jgi:hypothetical protein
MSLWHGLQKEVDEKSDAAGTSTLGRRAEGEAGYHAYVSMNQHTYCNYLWKQLPVGNGKGFREESGFLLSRCPFMM